MRVDPGKSPRERAVRFTARNLGHALEVATRMEEWAPEGWSYDLAHIARERAANGRSKGSRRHVTVVFYHGSEDAPEPDWNDLMGALAREGCR